MAGEQCLTCWDSLKVDGKPCPACVPTIIRARKDVAQYKSYTSGYMVGEALTTTLVHLKAVLGGLDVSHNAHTGKIGWLCRECDKEVNDNDMCLNKACPRYQARQHVKEMEA